MDTTIITDQMLEEIILGKVNDKEEKFLINSIHHASHSTLKGTIIEIVSTEKNVKDVSRVIFDKFSIVIEGPLKQYEQEINKAYIDSLCESSAKFKAFFEDAMLKIDAKTAAFKLRLVENFYQNGYVKNDIKGIFKGMGVAQLQSRLDKNKHSEIISPTDNKFKKIRRIEITPGQIITADLNPILENEIGGIRPVLIVRVLKDNVVVLPISSAIEKNVNSGTVFYLPKNLYEGYYNKDSVICIDFVRTISQDRLLHNVTQMHQKDFDTVLNLLAVSILGKDFIHNQQQQKIFNVDKGCEVEYQQLENKPEPVEFVLTQDEVRDIANKKIDWMWRRGSRLSFFDDAEICGDGVLKKGISIFFNRNHRNPKQKIYPTEFLFKPFSADVIIGDKKITNDFDLVECMVKKLSEKYPEVYPRLYASFQITSQANCFEKFHDLDKCVERLDTYLSFIGKKAWNTEDLVRYGICAFKFEDLIDIKQNNEKL